MYILVYLYIFTIFFLNESSYLIIVSLNVHFFGLFFIIFEFKRMQSIIMLPFQNFNPRFYGCIDNNKPLI